MQETLNQIRMIFWMTLHYRWTALLAASLVCLAGWAGVQLLPDQYQVISRVYMDTQSVLTPLLKGLAVDSMVTERSAEVVRRTLVSRPNLEQVIRETDMDIDVENEFQYESLIQKLIAKIEIDGGERTNNIFTITYVDKSPVKAKDVVDKLLTIFLEKVLGISRTDSTAAGAFLEQQIKSYEQRLEAVEKQLADFKAEHPDFTPTVSTTYYQRLETVRAGMAEAKLQLEEAQRKYQTLEQQLQQVGKSLADQEKTGATTNAAQLSPLDLRIEELKKSLDQLLLSYTEEHPDVLSTKRLLEGLEKQRAEQREQVMAAGGVTPQLSANPLFQQLSAVRSNARAELAGLEARVENFQQKATALEAEVGTMPQLEAEYTSLTRSYQIIRNTYEELVQRRESAALGKEVEEKTDSVQFRIIDPPIVPVKPIGPNRPLLNVAVLLAGLGIGAGMAFAMAQMRPTFYSQKQLLEKTGLPVLGVVSMVWSREQLQSRRKNILFYSGFLLLLLLIFAVVMASSLSDVWFAP